MLRVEGVGEDCVALGYKIELCMVFETSSTTKITQEAAFGLKSNSHRELRFCAVLSTTLFSPH